MAAASGPAHPAAASGGGGPLSFMGCMRESSPPPYEEHLHHHHGRPVGLPTGEFPALGQGFDSIPKEPKKRRFHPLRGLRRIFRKKSRGAADARPAGAGGCAEREASGERDREEVTLRDPAGRADEVRSRSASELLTESGECDRIFVRRRGIEESFANLQRGSGVGQLSVSHDSVFPGEVSHARPLSSLDMHASLERRATAKGSNGNEVEHKDSQTAQRHRISLRVLEQIKTVIENRNQIAVATTAGTTTTTTTTTTTITETTNSLHNRLASRDRSERTSADDAHQAKVSRKDTPTATNASTNETPSSPLKEELPELPTSNLKHTAALHRIAVRPKNRRPPRRSTSQSSSANTTSNGPPRIDSISENSFDTLDSLEGIAPVDASVGSSNPPGDSSSLSSSPPPPTAPTTASPQETPTKPIPILRKSSSRRSRNSDVFEELEAKLPGIRKPAVSPDSLETNLDSKSSAEVLDEDDFAAGRTTQIPKPSPRTASLGSDGYEKPASSPRRRLSSSNRLSKSPDSLESNSPGWLTKSSDSFDKLCDLDEDNDDDGGVERRPIAARRLLLKPISKSQERVCGGGNGNGNGNGKLAGSFEALNSDDSIERRRGSFEIRPRRPSKLMSKSTDCFESTLVEQQQRLVVGSEERRKRASLSEANLSRGSRYSKLLYKSSESFEKLANLSERRRAESSEKVNSWAVARGMANSSEGSDCLDPMDEDRKLESRPKAGSSTPKRLSGESFGEGRRARKPPAAQPRMQKSSESSELGSTDTLDSERRNTIKSSDSDETLDSLERELHRSQPELDRKDEEMTESAAVERARDKQACCSEEEEEEEEEQLEAEVAVEEEDEDEKLGSFWRRRRASKDASNNLDIHQLLACTFVSRIHQQQQQENGNGGELTAANEVNNAAHNEERRAARTIRGGSPAPLVVYPKKKQHPALQQPAQSGPDNNKYLSNMLASRTDEDLQNMLNGNISEVSTDTKSFKEKLIMFEKLGK